MELVKQETQFSCALAAITETQQMVEALMKTPHYAKMGAEGIFAITAKAKSLNINVLDALNGSLYYLNGKVGMAAEMMAAMIRVAGHSIIKDPKSDDCICILHGKRKDNGDTWTVKFSVDDARRAGLMKNTYDKYTSSMLYNRAMSMLARQLYPDVIKGAGYTHDELREIADNNPSDAYKAYACEPVQVVTEKVTREEAEEIIAVLDKCDAEYVSRVMTSLKKLVPPIESMYDLPKEYYVRILMAAKKRATETHVESDLVEAESE